MKITRLSIWHIPLVSHEVYYMADGKTCDTVETVVVRIETDSRYCGWGEVCPIPHYLPAYARGVVPAINEMSSQLLGADPIGAEGLMDQLHAFLPGHVYAKSAIDIALWDLTGKQAGLPLYGLFGGRRVENLPLYHSITCIDPDEMARIALDAYGQGIRQFQVKLGVDENWETDVARLTKVREAVGSAPLVYGDWNCGASQLSAIRIGRAVRHLDVMLEQPCQSIESCAAVKTATGLPMKLDESAHDIDSVLRGARLGCMDAVAIKLSKFGGLSAARRARDLCSYLGSLMCIEDTWGSDIATASALHLAASTHSARVLNVCDLSSYTEPRLAPDAPVRSNGKISPPQMPGLGIEPDLDLLGEADIIID